MGKQEKPNDDDNWDPRDLENEEEEEKVQLPDNVMQMMFQNLAMNIPHSSRQYTAARNVRRTLAKISHRTGGRAGR